MQSNVGGVKFVTAPVTGNDVSPQTGDLIKANALQYGFRKLTNFNLGVADTPVTKTVFLFQADSNGYITGFNANVITPGSSASVTVDLKKNGTSILSAVITMTNATPAATKQAATISSSSYSAGDWFEAVLTVSSSTGMQGVNAWVNGYETAQPV